MPKEYADGGQFWKGKVPPSSTAKPSRGGITTATNYKANSGGGVRKYKEIGISGTNKYVSIPTRDVRKHEDDFPNTGKKYPFIQRGQMPMKGMPRGQMENKTTGIARAKEVASSKARGLFNKAAKVKDVISRIGARRKAKKQGLSK